MFYLGSHCQPLPAEPEPLNREYFNIGLKVYSNVHEIRNLKSKIRLSTSQISDKQENNDNWKKFAYETFDDITKIYQSSCKMLSSIPDIAQSKAMIQIKAWVAMNYYNVEKIDLHLFLPDHIYRPIYHFAMDIRDIKCH